MPRVRTAQEAGFGNSQRAALPNVARQENNIQTNSAMFGGATADAMAQGAKALNSVGDDLYRNEYYKQKLAKQNDTLEATNLDNEMQKEALDLQFNPQTGFYSQKGAAAVGLPEQAAKRLEELQAKYQAQATTPQAAALFAKSFGTFRNSVLEGVSRHSLSQNQAYMTDTVKARTDLNAEKAGLEYNDDKAYGKFLTDNTSAIVAQASTEGWSSDKFRDELWKSNSALYKSRAYSMLNNPDPSVVVQGAEFYQAAVERGDLTMADVKELDAMRDAAYPRALATRSLAEVSAGSSFANMTADQVFEAGIIAQESGGRRYEKDGVTLLTSSAGARGEAQVLDSTMTDPGLGVRPADLSGTPTQQADERRRVGKDYFNTLVTRYNDMSLGALAYNWGFDNVDKHIAKMGDPTKGQISLDRFLASVPSKEAREYVPGVRAKLGIAGGSGMETIDGGVAAAKAAELEKQWPGAGADFLAMVDKQNKTIADAKKMADAELVAKGATFMQESNGDIASVPADLKAQLIRAGKWDEVAKYTGVSDRKTTITLDTMSDEQFAAVNLADYTLKLSAADMETRIKRQQVIRNGDEGYKAFTTQRSTYWMQIAGDDASASSEDKARFNEMADRRFEAFKKENKRAPNREEARVIFQTLSTEANGGRIYQQPSDAKVLTDSGYESTDIGRYNSILAANNFDINEDNQELLRTNPQAIIGPVDGVPPEKILPIVDRLTRGGLPATPTTVREYYVRETNSTPDILGLALDAFDAITGKRTSNRGAAAPYPKIGG